MASSSTFACPVCGGAVPARAKACPHCGACEKSGWNEASTLYDGIDLPGEDFDYDKFTREEFGGRRSRSRGRELLWKITAVLLLILTLVLVITNYLFRQ